MVTGPAAVAIGGLLDGLLILFGVFVVALGVVVFGFILATKAGDGSQRALAGWAVVLAAEAMTWGVTALFLVQSNAAWALVVVPIVVGLQVALFVLIRRSAV